MKKLSQNLGSVKSTTYFCFNKTLQIMSHSTNNYKTLTVTFFQIVVNGKVAKEYDLNYLHAKGLYTPEQIGDYMLIQLAKGKRLHPSKKVRIETEERVYQQISTQKPTIVNKTVVPTVSLN